MPVPPMPVSPMIDATLPGSEPEATAARNRAWEAVAIARTRTLDALAGFEKMAEHAEPDFAPIVRAFVELHRRHGEEFTRLLADNAVAPDEGGSIMGTVNRVVVATRALFDEIDEDVLTQIHSGERHVVDAYAEAADTNLPETARDKVAEMLVELREILTDTRPS
ncbi:DUF2383 domain-containing protein [Rhodobacter sp. SY28-1]|uniref:DUF2383 domain-containing protein n=1 Tax=Rhodobacter sp. SY28-1 TaxID=2562317 RepID=UPI001485A021|nr:DUF2383 domain-containing protein [Rhodobacter sp. SY28-1]